MPSPSLFAGTNRPDHVVSPEARIVRWPAQQASLAELQRCGVARLIVVDDGAEPPVGADCCQDWMWRSGGEGEMRLRLQQLSLRALEHGRGWPQIDAVGMLRVGLRSVHLPAKERTLAALLLREFGRPVLRDELIRAAWPKGIAGPNVLASRISALRSRLAWLGLEIRGSSSTGYFLCTSHSLSDTGGFEEELSSAAWADGGRIG